MGVQSTSPLGGGGGGGGSRCVACNNKTTQISGWILSLNAGEVLFAQDEDVRGWVGGQRRPLKMSLSLLLLLIGAYRRMRETNHVVGHDGMLALVLSPGGRKLPKYFSTQLYPFIPLPFLFLVYTYAMMAGSWHCISYLLLFSRPSVYAHDAPLLIGRTIGSIW